MRKIFIYFLSFICISVNIYAVSSNMNLKARKYKLGDMLRKNEIRVLVPYSKTFYFFDGAEQRGLTYEILKLFEKHINDKFKKEKVKIKIVIIPTKRDNLFPYLVKGYGDIAAGNLTITDNRLEKVDFTDPVLKNISEIVVTEPDMKKIKKLENLNLYLRQSSSYYESVQSINKRLKKLDKKEIKYVEANEILEDEDILEMINAGLISMTVVDSHIAQFWEKIFPDLNYHYDIKLRSNASIAWAIRKNSPALKKIINGFVEKNKKGTYYGNIYYNKYLKNNKWVTNPLKSESVKRLDVASPYFKKYSDAFDLDWLFIAAVAFQESRIDQSVRSPAGAVGVMQVLPSTASDPQINIANIYFIGNNIHAGAKYLKYLSEKYIDTENVDRLNIMLFTLAGYNAGPGRLKKLRDEADKLGYDKNKWFQNVEVIAAKRIGNETVQYVSNIYKYYIAYLMLYGKLQEKENIKKQLM